MKQDPSHGVLWITGTDPKRTAGSLMSGFSSGYFANMVFGKQVKVRVGDAEFNAIARVVHEPQLAATVKALFDAEYGWSDGLIAELTPA